MARLRDLKIDTARGIACLLLIAYHVIGSGPNMGMRVPDGHWIRDTNDILGLVRMPLFTILSAIVYAAHPVSRDGILTFVRGKALRLLPPLIFVAVPFALLQKLTPGANADKGWLDVALVPFARFAHYWFLHALFIVFLAVVVMEMAGALRTLRRAAATLAAALILYALEDLTDIFSIGKAFYLLPFFISGLILARFSSSIYRPDTTSLVIVGLSAVALIGAIVVKVEGLAYLEPMVGISFATLLLAVIRPVPVLSFIGYYSYSIYLFHVFGTAGVRIALKKVGIDDWLLIFVVSMLVGTGLPIIIHLVAIRVPYVSRALLGARTKRQVTAVRAAKDQAPATGFHMQREA